nr:hypothetical protein [Lachnospiraceae bacterium]
IDSADKDAGKVLVQNSYQNGSTAQSTCENYVKGSNPKFILSSNLPKAKTSSADASEVNATYSSANTYHDAVLRAGQGLQNTTSETNNPEIMNKEFTNGAEGTLVLSCYLDVTYDLSKVEEITGLSASTYAANGIVDNNYNRNIWKEGFTTSDSEFNNYSNNNDYEVKLSSSNIELDTTHGSSNNLSDIISEVNDGADIIDLLVVGKTYSSGNSKATEGADSYTFLGWCLQEDGSGYIYSSPTSFPIGNSYKWYPIFDVAYSLEYNSNYATPNRSDLGGEMHYDSYDNGSSVERTTLSTSTKDMTSIAEDTFFKVSSKDETTHLYATSEVLGNCGPNLDIPNYWEKKIETTHKNIYTELDEDYTYWYKFIGWSLNQNSNFTDIFNSDHTKKVYTTSDVENFISPKISYVENNFIVNNADRLSRLKFLENHSDFIKVKEVDNQSLLYVTMYAIWDEYPEIFAKDFTLMSNDAALTNADTFKQAVIDNYITATDYELNYKSDEHLIVTVENLDYDAIKSIGHGGDDVGTVSVTVKVVDEVGNASYDTCDVTIISSTGMTSPSDGENASLYVRFVDEENWLKNDFWNIIFANGTKSIKDFGDTDRQQIAKMEQICDAYELWLSQTGLSLEVERILEGTISVEAMNALRDLGTSKSNIQRTMENNSNDGAMDPYSKWYLNPQLVLEINESFDGIVSNPQ